MYNKEWVFLLAEYLSNHIQIVNACFHYAIIYRLS